MQPAKLIKLSEKERGRLVERLNASSLSAQDRQLIVAAIDTLALLNQAYENKKISIKRLLKMIFGPTSEKSKDVLKEKSKTSTSSQTCTTPEKDTDKQKKRKGHGRNPAAAYTGAQKQFIAHPDLVPGDPCPGCLKGKVYRSAQPQVVVRVEGGAPLSAMVQEYDQLRCNLCGEIFTSKPPEIKESRLYDQSVSPIIALLKYGHGFPFYRLEKLQQSVGVPLASSTQWDLIKAFYPMVYPAYGALLELAGQADIVYNDDTSVKILEIMAEKRQDGRSGIFTSGIVAQVDAKYIALFFSGVDHAGENLAKVLEQRDADRSPPIHMCDALSRNYSNEFKTILCHCLIHGRRKFVDVITGFPDECEYVIETLAKVYAHEDTAKQLDLCAQQRLVHHQTHSQPLMESLHTWFNEQFDLKTVEPNSGLGRAISYMLDHWTQLTRFLHVPGAPLDNNICERALKQVILNRKNAYFFKTRFGAAVADMFMSLIYTCRLSNINPFKYLVALQVYAKKVAKEPDRWLPWNYQSAVAGANL